MNTDINGCSTCPNGTENYETFSVKIGRKTLTRMQYDYRHTDGALFSCVGKDLQDCRNRRDKWYDERYHVNVK